MVTLQYFNGTEWVYVSQWNHEKFAWLSLGGDDLNYRTIDDMGNVLTDRSV
jgi:expansin (peptidoglycan-binding protein)